MKHPETIQLMLIQLDLNFGKLFYILFFKFYLDFYILYIEQYTE